ncbi:MAG: GMC family oxidoreductase [Candidatus Eremiobacteraeota bacterium]|nr:GMC family oxidoreductase [Candidatus Eremiobacteraeota bacterium]
MREERGFSMSEKRMECEYLVVGSGPGGATTAALLAGGGRDVLMAEEGGNYRLDSAEAYSLLEMDQKYRNSGLTPSFGKTKVTYIEGRCVGGGSEINAALCHLPMECTIEEWRKDFKIEEFSYGALEPHFREIDKDFTVSPIPYGLDAASRRIKEGAAALGWASDEVKRFWRYPENAGLENTGIRQSITETMVPKALASGCRLEADLWIEKLIMSGNRAVSAVGIEKSGDGRREKVRIDFKNVVVCGGPSQTPVLLQRSGIGGLVGKSFVLHPMVRMPARFNEEINECASYGVPVQQVVEFKPAMTLGCSVSTLPHLAMWMGEDVEDRMGRLREWRTMTLFYVLVKGNARGSVKNVPGFNEAFVSYPLNEKDLKQLGEGLYLLGKLLFTVGALEILSPVLGMRPFRKLEDLELLRQGLPHAKMTVSTIHIFSSCPMGEDRSRCVVDSFGKLHGYQNIWLNDASILPDATGVNPQATVMAVARRNALKMLG